jgi:hypothetical protein
LHDNRFTANSVRVARTMGTNNAKYGPVPAKLEDRLRDRAARNKTFFAGSGDQMWLANDIRMILKPYSAVITAPAP